MFTYTVSLAGALVCVAPPRTYATLTHPAVRIARVADILQATGGSYFKKEPSPDGGKCRFLKSLGQGDFSLPRRKHLG